MKNKKILYTVIAVILLVGIVLVFIFTTKNKDTYTTITSTDGSFSIEINSKIPYKINTKEDSTFPLDLYYAQDEMYAYVSRIEKQRTITLLDVVTEDKTHYLSDKQNIREDSGINPITIENYSAYEYTFTYYDASYQKDFYADIVWIETEKNLYVLNLEVVSSHKNAYQDAFLKMINSFKEL